MADATMPKNNQNTNHTPKPSHDANQSHQTITPGEGVDKTSHVVSNPAKEAKSATNNNNDEDDDEAEEEKE